MKVVIAGGRNFRDYAVLKEAISRIQFQEMPVIISGGATGADSLGERFAKENGYPLLRFPAQWGVYGKAAGPIRNVRMAEEADAVICFWDGYSPGTKHMIKATKDRKKALIVFDYRGRVIQTANV